MRETQLRTLSNLQVGLAHPGVTGLVTRTIPAVINWCLRPYALPGLSGVHSRGVSDLVTWTIPAVVK
jgi:hypothetical protein